MPEIDFSSAAWRQVVKWAEDELQQARIRNEKVELTEAETSAVRGEIRFIKRLLSLPGKTATMAKFGAPPEV